MDDTQDTRKTLRISEATHRVLRAYCSLLGREIQTVAEELLMEGMRRNPAEGLTIPSEVA